MDDAARKWTNSSLVKISCSSSRHGVDVKIRTGRQAVATGLVVVFTFLLDRRQQRVLLVRFYSGAFSFGGISRAKTATL
jgi:hypothetical protein